MFDARVSTLLRRAARLVTRPAAATTDAALLDRFTRGGRRLGGGPRRARRGTRPPAGLAPRPAPALLLRRADSGRGGRGARLELADAQGPGRPRPGGAAVAADPPRGRVAGRAVRPA